jgi:ribonuclease III
LIDGLPADLRRRAVTHSSWVEHRADSYGRLAFLGDGVLGLGVAEHLFRRFPRADIGRLTKVHGQAVSGRACVEVAEVLGLPGMLRAAAPRDLEGGIDPEALVASERALASVCEAVIGACYLHHGFEATAEATVAAFAHQIELASGTLLDFKSALQELLAREGARVTYDVIHEAGPPHDRRFEVAARVDAEVIGRGEGRSKKAAEQAAAAEALERRSG